ncbi:MAG TPA: 2-oxoacid:acceptor oxidoreductase subunit alpha [Methanobacterium sp.]
MSIDSSSKDISIVLCGEAGQGIQTVETILVKAIKKSGYNVFSTKEYMSRVRGGENSTEIRVSSKRVFSYVDRIDILLALSEGAVPHLENRITSKTLIMGDEKHLKNFSKDKYDLLGVKLLEIATEMGGAIFSTVIAAGIISCILNVPKSVFESCIQEIFSRKGEEIVKKDTNAGMKGYEIGKELVDSGRINIQIEKNSKVLDEILLDGTEAVGLGCIAGGCKFMSSYPMTPSTPLQVFMAANSEKFGMIFEQAEDEIAAINMAIGGFYAGARSMVATSGSGFALMEEAVGLSGMIETPIVIYIGQRPGPAVGLPTRTSQEDLNLALYSGPGEFPRIIFAPGNFEDAFYLSQKAFNLADQYQTPVFILSDQYFADVFYNQPNFDLEGLEVENHIVKTNLDYKRYEITTNGISPRGIPGFGDGLVVVDSDEHDEKGHLTEDLDVRIKMVDKRLRKLKEIEKETISPELLGSEEYKTLVIGWGSNYGPIKEALENLKDDSIGFLYFKQLYPLHHSTKNFLNNAEKTVIFENNAQGQFSDLIKLKTGFEIDKKVLKYNGMPFSVEEVEKNLRKFTEG